MQQATVPNGLAAKQLVAECTDIKGSLAIMKQTKWRWRLCGLALISTLSWGQSGDILEQIRHSTPLERAEAQAEVLSDVLGLTPQQSGELIQINLKYSTRIQALMDKGVEDTVLYLNIQEFADAKDNEIKALLTNQQVRRYEAHKAKLRQIVEDVIQMRNR